VRIAIFSDVHGNAAALRAVLEAIDRLEPDRVYCLGDLVGRGPEPDAVVRMIEKRGITSLRGNWDEWVAGEDGWDARPKRRAHVEAARRLMKKSTIAHLSSGAGTLRISAAGAIIFLAHGSPRDPVELLGPDTPDEQLRAAIAPAGNADIVAVGHSHRAFVRKIDGTLVINTGTVGYPFDGDPRASFALLDLRGPARAELIRVPYPLAKNLRALDRAVKKKAIPASLADRYRRALLGEGDALPELASEEAAGVEAILRFIARPLRLAYAELRSLDALRSLRERLAVIVPALAPARARRALARLDRELALLSRIAEVEELARDPALAELAAVRLRRLRARLGDLFPEERRIRDGLVWLGSAMRPRDGVSTIAELRARTRVRAVEVESMEEYAARLRTRALRRGGSGAQ
jgi:putative phosphoesterase